MAQDQRIGDSERSNRGADRDGCFSRGVHCASHAQVVNGLKKKKPTFTIGARALADMAGVSYVTLMRHFRNGDLPYPASTGGEAPGQGQEMRFTQTEAERIVKLEQKLDRSFKTAGRPRQTTKHRPRN